METALTLREWIGARAAGYRVLTITIEGQVVYRFWGYTRQIKAARRPMRIKATFLPCKAWS